MLMTLHHICHGLIQFITTTP